ncbi:hypothetical protein ABES02_29095 [Neobacillus pocheonensis]|uniref:hypothetical protein n=1 Tax=Neobacillus pocheonensis TaxID=363869 RepID=UPI003D2ACCE9
MKEQLQVSQVLQLLSVIGELKRMEEKIESLFMADKTKFFESPLYQLENMVLDLIIPDRETLEASDQEEFFKRLLKDPQLNKIDDETLFLKHIIPAMGLQGDPRNLYYSGMQMHLRGVQRQLEEESRRWGGLPNEASNGKN